MADMSQLQGVNDGRRRSVDGSPRLQIRGDESALPMTIMNFKSDNSLIAL
jgi:hypothetical protein